MMKLRPRLQIAALAGLCMLWVGGIVAGIVSLNRYKSKPGAAAAAPSSWPAESRIERDDERPTLLFFAHPLCPCTRASVAELGKLLDRHGDRVRTVVVAMRPLSATKEWRASGMLERARRFPSSTIIEDPGAIESGHFGAKTSGTAMLYSPDGSLLFKGGLTVARGHQGDNPGAGAIASLLTDGTAATGTPVFGCSLIHPERALPRR